MKRIICLLFAFVFFICGCSEAEDDYGANPSNSYPIDLSYESINQLTDFKCYVSYNDSTSTVEGAHAKELYRLVYHAMNENEHTPLSSNGNYVYLVFYTGEEAFPLEKVDIFFGTYTVYDDGIMVFSGSPYHSAAFDYVIESSLFDLVVDSIFSGN